jgi:hypothetical protein
VSETLQAQNALDALESRLKTLLPEQYAGCYEDVQPVPMGSAGLKYDVDGRVAWDEIWQSFCDLAMAGGPPHKGTLLGPAPRADIERQRERFEEVASEICRGIIMVTDLQAQLSPVPGWVRLLCLSDEMAGWLLRAIVMENVAVRREGRAIDLPAAPGFRLEKEVKNVVTVIAKTCHYWMGHMPRTQKQSIAALFATMAAETPLIEPSLSNDGVRLPDEQKVSDRLADVIQQRTGLRATGHQYPGWLGVECPSVHGAVWMMRALVASNVLSRREATALFVPVNPVSDPDGEIVAKPVIRVHELAAVRGAL